MDDIQRHIKKLLLDNVKLDVIYDYISATVTEIDNNFIRALTTAVVDSSLDNRFKLNDKHFLSRIPLLERYIDGNNQLQLQALIAIQILIHRLEHPKGLMQSIFSNLVTEKIISTDSIMNWKNRTDVMYGKDVDVTSLLGHGNIWILESNFLSEELAGITDEDPTILLNFFPEYINTFIDSMKNACATYNSLPEFPNLRHVDVATITSYQFCALFAKQLAESGRNCYSKEVPRGLFLVGPNDAIYYQFLMSKIALFCNHPIIQAVFRDCTAIDANFRLGALGAIASSSFEDLVCVSKFLAISEGSINPFQEFSPEIV